MSAEDLKEPMADGRALAVAALVSLSGLSESQVSAVMLIVQRRDEPPDVSQLRPTQAAVPPLSAVIQAVADEYRECEVIDYGPATSTADGEAMWVSTADVPLLQAIASESQDLANLPLFDPNKAKLSDLRLAAMRSEIGTTTAVFIQSLRGAQVVAQSKRFGVLVRRGVLDVPKSGHLLLLGRDVTVIVVGQVALFRDRKAFQRLFGYLDELREQAEATFLTVTAELRIDGLDQMLLAVTGSPAMLGKMASIQRKLDTYPQYKAALTMSKITDFVLSHPECEVELAGKADQAKLVFKSDPQHRFKILKLLDDDYLRSELTALEYEANSKSAPIGGMQ